MTTLMIATVLVATNLPTVVVEASRVGREPMELAQHVEVFDAAAIRATDAKDLPQLAARASWRFSTVPRPFSTATAHLPA